MPSITFYISTKKFDALSEKYPKMTFKELQDHLLKKFNVLIEEEVRINDRKK
jgi:hypothetical protein